MRGGLLLVLGKDDARCPGPSGVKDGWYLADAGAAHFRGGSDSMTTSPSRQRAWAITHFPRMICYTLCLQLLLLSSGIVFSAIPDFAGEKWDFNFVLVVNTSEASASLIVQFTERNLTAV